MVDDLISRQATIKAFKDFLTIHDSRGVEYLCSAVTMDGVNKILSDLSSVDAVRVVRCKNCIYCELNTDESVAWCNVWGNTTLRDGYCFYGERKDE